MEHDDTNELSGRLRAVLADCDETDPRYPMYATFLQDLHHALRHAARGYSSAIARTIRRWTDRGLCEGLLRRLADAMVQTLPKVSHGPQH